MYAKVTDQTTSALINPFPLLHICIYKSEKRQAHFQNFSNFSCWNLFPPIFPQVESEIAGAPNWRRVPGFPIYATGGCHGIWYWDTCMPADIWYWDTCMLILRYMHASWDQCLCFFFPGQPLKDDVGKCVEAALKKYDEQKNVVWISLRWQLHDIWYFIYIFSLIILVLGDHRVISFLIIVDHHHLNV